MTHAIGCLRRPLKSNFLEWRLKWAVPRRLQSGPGRAETCGKVSLGRPAPAPRVCRGESQVLFFFFFEILEGRPSNPLSRGPGEKGLLEAGLSSGALTVSLWAAGSAIGGERGPVVVRVRLRDAAPGEDGHDRLLLRRLWADLQDEPARPSAGLAVATPGQGHHQDGMQP